MSNEEMNKKMEFIVEQQAKFAADIEIMREVQAAQYNKLSDALVGVVDIVGSLARAQVRTEESINSVADSVEKLTQAQMRTDERLNNLINVVERHISGNGGSENRA
jgi:ABC-type transporter Mla subunit MlaD